MQLSKDPSILRHWNLRGTDEAVLNKLNKVLNPLFKVSKDGFNRSFIIEVPTGITLIEGIFSQCKTMFEAFPFKVLFSRCTM
jgi:hypothetical protein